MKIKKYYGSYTVIFDLLNDETEIMFEKELDDIFFSFEESTIINKTLPYNDLIKLQQSNPKHILVENEVRPLDHIRLLLKFLNNFLCITQQTKNFVVDSLILQGEKEIIAYGSEIYQYSIKNITFSPTARLKWSNPQLINKIIDKG